MCKFMVRKEGGKKVVCWSRWTEDKVVGQEGGAWVPLGGWPDVTGGGV